jgi:hypothetical protein
MFIKIAPTCFGAVKPSSGSSLSVLAKVTLCYQSVTLANADNYLPEDGVTAPKHFGAVLM